MNRLLLLALVTLALGACGLLPNRTASCAKPKPYESAVQLPALRVGGHGAAGYA